MSSKNKHRKQKKREKQRKKRSKKQAVASEKRRAELPSGGLRNASGWPLGECWVTGNWHEWEAVVTGIVVRRHPTGMVAGAVFEVDLAERKLKSASVVRDHQVQQALEGVSGDEVHLEQCPPELLARLVGEAASQSEVSSKRYSKAFKMLDGVEPEDSEAEFRWGYEIEEADTDERANEKAGLLDRVKGWFGA